MGRTCGVDYECFSETTQRLEMSVQLPFTLGAGERLTISCDAAGQPPYSIDGSIGHQTWSAAALLGNTLSCPMVERTGPPAWESSGEVTELSFGADPAWIDVTLQSQAFARTVRDGEDALDVAGQSMLEIRSFQVRVE